MNRWITWIILVAGMPLFAAETKSPDIGKLRERYSASFVRVEFELQYDKGDAPFGAVGDEQRMERSRPGILAQLIEEQRPSEAAGFLIGPNEVATTDPGIHPRFVKSITVRRGDEWSPAKITRFARDRWGVVLTLDKQLKGTKPIAFASKTGKATQMLTYYRSNGEWGFHALSFPSELVAVDRGPTSRPVQYAGVALGGDGEALGLVLDNLPGDDSWQGSPSKWPWVPAADVDARLNELEKAAGNTLVRVRLSFRSPKITPNQQRRYDREDNEEDDTTERDVLGLVLPDGKLLIPASLKPRVTSRLQRITAFPDGGQPVNAKFTASLKDFGALIATLESPLGGGSKIYDSDVTGLLDELLLRTDISVQGETRAAYFSAGRYGYLRVGPRLEIYPELVDQNARSAWLFTMDRQLVALPVARREQINSRRERFGAQREDIRLTPARLLAAAVGDLAANADPANVPATEDDENRLAWLGVELQPLTRELARANGVSDQTRDGESGAIVTYVHPDSPAAKAGIQSGAILLRLRVPGQSVPIEVQLEEDQMRAGPFPWDRLDEIREQYFDRIPTPWPPAENSFTRALTDLGFNRKFTAEVFVDGKLVDKEFTVEPGPVHYESAARFKSDALGITVRDVTYDVRRYLQRKSEDPGVVVAKIEPGGKASVAGVKPYELITHVNEQPVSNAKDFERLAGAGGELKLSIKRMAKGRIVTVKAGS